MKNYAAMQTEGEWEVYSREGTGDWKDHCRCGTDDAARERAELTAFYLNFYALGLEVLAEIDKLVQPKEKAPRRS